VPFDVVRGVIKVLTTEASYNQLTTDLTNYWIEHDLERLLATHSVAYLSNHHYFSDIPVLGVATSDTRLADPYFAQRNVLVTGRMIPGIEADINNDGNYAEIIPMLRWFARILQTVPGLPEDASEALKAMRKFMIEDMKSVLDKLLDTPGSILYMAASGTHDATDKKRLGMHSISPAIKELLANGRTIIIPTFMSCDSFTGGIHPGTAYYKLLPPVITDEPEEIVNTMHDIAAAGNSIPEIKAQFPNGVIYDPSLRKIVRARVDRAAEGIQRLIDLRREQFGDDHDPLDHDHL
jgi:hypothetical protein